MKKAIAIFLAILIAELPALASRSLNGTSSDYLTAADSASLDSPSTALTVAFWIRTDSATQAGYAGILRKTRGSSYSWVVEQIATTAGKIEFYVAAGTTAGVQATTAMTVGTWYFVVGRWTSGGTVNLNIYNTDGSSFGSYAGSTLSGSITYTSASALYVGPSDTTHVFNGTITNIFVTNTSLSDPDVATLRGGTAPVTASAIWAPLCGNSPELDLSGNGNNLTVNGTTASAQPAGVGGCAGTKGTLSGAVKLGGAGKIS